MSTGYDELRKYFSNYVQGTNVDGVLHAFGGAYDILQQNSIAVTDQLTICTAIGKYLDLITAEKGVTRPPELGISDFAYRNLAITITAQKQITTVIHKILEIFYGADAVRGHSISGNPEPYDLSGQADLQVKFEDGETQTIVFNPLDFQNIQQATAQEVVNFINTSLLQLQVNSFALVHTDVETQMNHVEIYGAARGPYSLVQVWGGKAQLEMQFPEFRDTSLPSNTTVWQITKNNETSIRFRWDSGPEPKLEDIFIGDRVLIYGAPFINTDSDLEGTFTVSNIRPTMGVPSYDTGWFEIVTQVPNLKNSAPNIAPPPNSPGNTYSYLVNQTVYKDLEFFLAIKNVPYSQPRFALAFEPAPSLLNIFLPATTNVIQRDLIGAAHLHMLYPSTDFNGAHGSASDDSMKIQIINDYAVRYYEDQMDNEGTGGTMTYGITTKTIERIYREDTYVTVIITEPHELVGDNQWLPGGNYTTGTNKVYNGRLWNALQDSGPGFGGSEEPMQGSLYWNDIGATLNLTSTIVTLTVDKVLQDDPDHSFLGAYTWDTKGTYTLASANGIIRDTIVEGQTKNLLYVNGKFPNESGYLLFDLNEDNQEGPVPYIVSQPQTSNTIVNIQSISRIDTNITVVTDAPHNAIPFAEVVIAGTVNFNGSYLVQAVHSPTVYDLVGPALGDVAESIGTSTTIIDTEVSLLTLDPSYRFKSNHAIGSTISLLSAEVAYVPSIDGKDYSFYATGTADARIYCQDIINAIVALGINLKVTIIYPDGNGLGNWTDPTDLVGPGPFSEAASYVWSSSQVGQ